MERALNEKVNPKPATLASDPGFQKENAMATTVNAIDLLKADHDTVRGLFEKVSATSERAVKTRKELLTKIAQELSIHTTLEEEIFYPAFKESGSKEHEKMFYEAREEHRAVEELVLPDLKKTDPGGVEFSGRIKVLRELVEHHADEEEEEMFPEAKKIMSKGDLQELGQRIQKRKAELKKSK
jgi:hemerythrin superfamily protein